MSLGRPEFAVEAKFQNFFVSNFCNRLRKVRFAVAEQISFKKLQTAEKKRLQICGYAVAEQHFFKKLWSNIFF
jgi:hypothetical protein